MNPNNLKLIQIEENFGSNLSDKIEMPDWIFFQLTPEQFNFLSAH